jgi:hypothetical protein
MGFEPWQRHSDETALGVLLRQQATHMKTTTTTSLSLRAFFSSSQAFSLK